jgi:hypothetical protein
MLNVFVQEAFNVYKQTRGNTYVTLLLPLFSNHAHVEICLIY